MCRLAIRHWGAPDMSAQGAHPLVLPRACMLPLIVHCTLDPWAQSGQS